MNEQPRQTTLSIHEFCQRNKISRTHLHNMCKAGRGPKMMKAGRRVLISASAEREWRQLLETEAAPTEAEQADAPSKQVAKVEQKKLDHLAGLALAGGAGQNYRDATSSTGWALTADAVAERAYAIARAMLERAGA